MYSEQNYNKYSNSAVLSSVGYFGRWWSPGRLTILIPVHLGVYITRGKERLSRINTQTGPSCLPARKQQE